ncbi:MAG: diguanylate cyclase [Chloroflexi bacterium]|nr:diguanylate cyclase [Chloroflexota bacterium]
MPLPVKNYPRSKLLPGLPTSMQFYTIAEVAIILETKIEVVHKWIQEGLLPAVQFGSEKHMLRIRAQDVKQLQATSNGKVLNTITLSLGVSVFPQNGQRSEQLLRAADLALYRAKTNGRDRVEIALIEEETEEKTINKTDL